MILILAFTTGCAATHKYQGNNFPPLSSEKFPSYGVNSPITEEVEVKLPDGNGKTKMSSGSKSFTIDHDIEWDWSIKYENKKIVNDHAFDIYVKSQKIKT